MKTPPARLLDPRTAIAFLWLATLLVYSNSFQAGLVFDNASRVLDDTRIHAATASNIALIFQSDYWHPHLGSGIYRPFTTLSLLLNYAVFGNGTHPFGYHLLNWLLHAVNASLLYLLALRLLKANTAALAVAALWAVHPVLTESVTNVVGRADLLAGAGVLGGLLAYLYAADAGGAARWRWLAIAAAASAIGVFSKESAIVLPAVALLYDLFERRKPWAPGYAALAAPAALYWWQRVQVFANAVPRVVPYTDNPLIAADWLSAKLTAVKIIGKQLLLLLWPATLSADYSYNQIPISGPGDWRVWASLIACLALVAGAAMAWRRRSAAFFWIGMFFITLAPTSNLLLIIGSPMAERLLYLPAIGIIGCAVAAISTAFAGPRARAGLALLAAIGVALGVRAFVRNFDWKDDRSLWTAAAAASPASYKTHLMLAAANPDLAYPETEAAIAIVDPVPDHLNPAVPFINGGQVHRELGDRKAKTSPEESRRHYQRALDLLLRADRIRRAHDHTNREKAAREGTAFAALGAPQWAPLYQELGRVYERFSRFDEAIEAQRTALRFKLAPELYESLSVTYFRKGDREQSAVALLEGILVDPKNNKLAGELASLYRETDPSGCALQTVNGQQGLSLNCPSVHRQFCAAAVSVSRLYRDTGQSASAERTIRGAVDSLHCDAALFGQ